MQTGHFVLKLEFILSSYVLMDSGSITIHHFINRKHLSDGMLHFYEFSDQKSWVS